jgi:hypothetical protein
MLEKLNFFSLNFPSVLQVVHAICFYPQKKWLHVDVKHSLIVNALTSMNWKYKLDANSRSESKSSILMVIW